MRPGSLRPAAAWRLLASWPAAVQWAILLALSAFISLLWGAVGLPAALLLGPMIAGIVFSRAPPLCTAPHPAPRVRW